MSTPDDRVHELLSRPSVEALIYALRHPETWPAGFEWDYSECETCAIGLAQTLWAIPRTDTQYSDEFIARAFGMSVADAERIFIGSYRGVLYQEITARHVASALERWLEKRR